MKPGQIVKVNLWGNVKPGRVVSVNEGSITLDFLVIGGMFRLTVPDYWIIHDIPAAKGAIQ